MTLAAEPAKLFQIRLVQDSADANAEQMTIIHSTKEKDWTVSLNVQKQPLLDFRAVASASVENNSITGRPEIMITFSDEGRERFEEVTRKNIGRQLAIIFDGRLLSAPRIAEKIPAGKIAISVNLSAEEAGKLAKKIDRAAKK